MDETSSRTPDTPHILLTGLGLNSKKTTYEWRNKQFTASLAPLALLQLLKSPLRPNRVVVVATEKAIRSTWANFEEGLLQCPGIEPESPIEVPDGRNRDEFKEIIEAVARRFPEGAMLTLDITQGLRHLPFIFYALVLYLTSLRGVKLQGAFYGMGEAETPTKPLIDLSPLLELPQWFHAVRMFRDQGMALPMADLIQPLEMTLRQNAALHQKGSDPFIEDMKRVGRITHILNMLKKHAFAYEAALPLELGQISRQLIAPVEELATMDFVGLPPLPASLAEVISESAKSVAFSVRGTSKGKWKQKVSLNTGELDRQARMIDAYLDREQIPLAIGLMREWVVSWSMMQSDQTCNWLARAERKPYERRLGAIGALIKNKKFRNTVSPELYQFGIFWHRLTDELRNALHHHAMREDAIEKRPKEMDEIQRFWNRMRKGAIALPSFGGGKGRLLITPCRAKQDILISALKEIQPDNCLVIREDGVPGNEQFESKAEEWAIKLINIILSPDRFDVIGEKATDSAIQHILLDADEIVVNMTGDATAVNLTVLRLIEEACKLNRPIRCFVLTERTSNGQQEPDSCCHWIDTPPPWANYVERI